MRSDEISKLTQRHVAGGVLGAILIVLMPGIVGAAGAGHGRGGAVAPAQVVAGPHVVFDGTLGPGGPLQAVDGTYNITANLGTQIGPNLFHSFSRFDLNSVETAVFSGPPTVQNVLARVTGGVPSNIDGTLSCNIPGANFYLINPAGVIFGPDSSLDVGGSFAVTTADYVRLGTGTGIFRATNAAASVLSTAPPAAFGFLAPAPAAVSVQGASLSVASGQCLSLVGGNVSITNIATLSTTSGRVNVVAIGTSGEVTFDPASVLSEPTISTSPKGTIQVNGNSEIITDGTVSDPGHTEAGPITLMGGSIQLEQATLSAQTTGATPGAPVNLVATGTVSIETSASTGATISAMATTTSQPGGRASDISITAGSLNISGSGTVSSSTIGAGAAGNVNVTANSVLIDGQDLLGTFTGIGAQSATATTIGAAGGINIQANSVQVVNGGQVSAVAIGSGPGGNINITANNSLQLTSQGLVTTETLGNGGGGSIVVKAGSIAIDGASSPIPTGIFTNSGAGSNSSGGNLSVTATQAITLSHSGEISASTYGAGKGGDISINAAAVNIDGARSGAGAQTGILDETGPASPGDPANTGAGGAISINTGRLSTSGGGAIIATTFGAGTGGNIDVVAGNASLQGDNFTGFPTGVLADTVSPGTGQGGQVDIKVTGLLNIAGEAGVSATTYGAGDGGSVMVNADTIRVQGRAPGLPAIQDGSAIVAESGLNTITLQLAGGIAGNVQVTANTLTVSDGATVSAKAVGTADAGKVTILARQNLSLLNRGTVTAESAGAVAGDLTLTVGDRLYAANNSEVTIMGGTGGGILLIRAPSIVVANSTIDALSRNSNELVDIRSGALLLSDSQILTNAKTALPVTDLAKVLAPLSAAIALPEARLAPVCGVNLGTGINSFVVTGRGALPPGPGGWLPDSDSPTSQPPEAPAKKGTSPAATRPSP